MSPTNQLATVLGSPDYFPLSVDFRRGTMRFARMSPGTYKESVFLDFRLRSACSATLDLRIDDLLLLNASQDSIGKTHFILHTSYSCSTLLARYLESLSEFFVLKEPQILTYFALSRRRFSPLWEDAFGLCMRLLSRRYAPDQTVAIKVNDWGNSLSHRFLAHSNNVTMSFLMPPLREFLLSTLKTDQRRGWLQSRVRVAAREMAKSNPLAGLDSSRLRDCEASAFLWLFHRQICQKLQNGPDRHRVIALDSATITNSPARALSCIAELCSVPLSSTALDAVVSHPSLSRYSKDLSRPYDSSTRKRELTQLEERLGGEVSAGLEWASKYLDGEFSSLIE